MSNVQWETLYPILRQETSAPYFFDVSYTTILVPGTTVLNRPCPLHFATSFCSRLNSQRYARKSRYSDVFHTYQKLSIEFPSGWYTSIISFNIDLGSQRIDCSLEHYDQPTLITPWQIQEPRQLSFKKILECFFILRFTGKAVQVKYIGSKLK